MKGTLERFVRRRRIPVANQLAFREMVITNRNIVHLSSLIRCHRHFRCRSFLSEKIQQTDSFDGPIRRSNNFVLLGQKYFPIVQPDSGVQVSYFGGLPTAYLDPLHIRFPSADNARVGNWVDFCILIIFSFPYDIFSRRCWKLFRTLNLGHRLLLL